MMNTQSATTKRRALRFTPDDGTYAQIDPQCNHELGDFEPSIFALVVEESHNGCGLILLERDYLKLCENPSFLAQVGSLAPMRAEARWSMPIDETARRLGIQYVD